MPEKKKKEPELDPIPGFYAFLISWDEKKERYRVDVGDLGPYEAIGLLEHALYELRDQVPPLSWVGLPDIEDEDSEEEEENG
jgi:hypothetical protein